MADRRHAPARRTNRERGTALLLFPAGVMVLLILGAIAIDLSSVHLARRELLRTASQAADDAAAMLDADAVHRGDLRTIDTDRATSVARFELMAARLPGRLVGPPTVTVDRASGRVTVSASMTVDAVFGRVVPGSDRTRRIDVTVAGELVDVR